MEDRSKQVSRLYKIMKLLETRHGLTLKEIETMINEDLDKPYNNRTFRRDLEALSECGFPVYDEENEDGKRVWKLQEDYRKNPVPLTPSEAFALLCGEKLMEPFSGTFIFKSLQELYQKLKANLTPENRKNLEDFKKVIHIQISTHSNSGKNGDKVDVINGAIKDLKTVEMAYTPIRTTKPLKKRVNPYALFYREGALYFVGFCKKDKQLKTYAISRIQSLKLTDESFAPDFFSMEDFFNDSFGVFQGKPEAVELVFSAPTSRWVRERKWHHSQEFNPVGKDSLKMNLSVAVTPDFVQWVLKFGSQVEVIKPAKLKTSIKEEVWKLSKLYQMADSSPKKSPAKSVSRPDSRSRANLKKVV
ncbi:MAG: WYL domain-containing protein [Nitrospirae bacterium]|nr:WYL domain-containing protein [Nitrospirota bacterium]